MLPCGALPSSSAVHSRDPVLCALLLPCGALKFSPAAHSSACLPRSFETWYTRVSARVRASNNLSNLSICQSVNWPMGHPPPCQPGLFHKTWPNGASVCRVGGQSRNLLKGATPARYSSGSKAGRAGLSLKPSMHLQVLLVILSYIRYPISFKEAITIRLPQKKISSIYSRWSNYRLLCRHCLIATSRISTRPMGHREPQTV